jgi:hypothetical protein
MPGGELCIPLDSKYSSASDNRAFSKVQSKYRTKPTPIHPMGKLIFKEAVRGDISVNGTVAIQGTQGKTVGEPPIPAILLTD